MARTPLFAWMGRMIREAIQRETIPTTSSQAPALRRITAPTSTLETPVSRREFLKGMASVAGLMAVGGLAPASPAQSVSPSALQIPPKHHMPDSPVVIVGGGLGGLVTAYRLTRQGVPCTLYEGSQRLGGRVYTKRNFNPDGMFVELGGELVDTGHEDLIALCGELDIPLERFVPEKSPKNERGIEPAIYFSEGQVHTEAEVIGAFQPLARALADDIRRCFPDGEVQVPTYHTPFQAAWLDRLSLEEYLNDTAAKTGTAPWLIRLIKTAYTGEYGLDPNEQSALNLLVLIGVDTQDGFAMFGVSDEVMRIQCGNSRLVEALTQALASKITIHRGHRLLKMAYHERQLHMTFKTNVENRHVITERAVLAIPFSILRHVGGVDRLGLSSVKQTSIEEWGYGTNSKQMMGFRKRFWRDGNARIPANTGELFTDLPSQCYWETSRLQAGPSGILTNFLGGDAGRKATGQQWQAALHDLDHLYGVGGASAQADGNQAFFNWSRNPFVKGSYTCPRPGQYTTLMGSAQEPELDGRLFFAGEHCSVDWAGYMNGAVQSGNIAAQQVVVQLGQVSIARSLV